jgi:CubicO group peptidase (beta-lactamase class C family)
MKPESVHELASVSKQFVAGAILQLVDQGKISLDDSVRKHIADAPETWQKITVTHLLQHTSGLPDYLAALGEPKVANDLPRLTLQNSIFDKPLRFEPGSKWEYSNSGYMVLGWIVEAASGQSLKAYTERNIFAKVGLKQTYFNDSRAIIQNRAEGYTLRGKQVVKEEFSSTTFSGTADGHIMSSALDLMKWNAALHGGKLLKPETYKRMITPSSVSLRKNGANTSGYGFGIGYGQIGDQTVYQHGGGWMGTSTMLCYYPKLNMSIAILMNTDRVSENKLMEVLELRFVGKKLLSAKP